MDEEDILYDTGYTIYAECYIYIYGYRLIILINLPTHSNGFVSRRMILWLGVSCGRNLGEWALEEPS